MCEVGIMILSFGVLEIAKCLDMPGGHTVNLM